jgi:hypothetical protein
MQVAIQLENMELFIVLKLLSSIFGDFDNGPKDFRRTVANGEFQIINHFLASP